MIDNLVTSFQEMVSAIPVEKVGMGILIAVVGYGIYSLISEL